MTSTPRPGTRVVRLVAVVLWGILIGAAIYWAVGAIRDRDEVLRTTARFDPPVWAGQNVPWACSGGFYVRDADTIMLTIVAHCAKPGTTHRDIDGKVIGVFGPYAELAECPANRFCAPSDFLALALVPDRIPWGHLNMIDLGAGGYRTFEPGTRPLACADIELGDRVETNGREHFRSGPVLQIANYDDGADTIFPCMVTADIAVFVGDSGGAVLVDGQPAGVISRTMSGRLGFTPLAEGLENLGLTLCTTPDCDLSPELAVQPGS